MCISSTTSRSWSNSTEITLATIWREQNNWQRLHKTMIKIILQKVHLIKSRSKCKCYEDCSSPPLKSLIFFFFFCNCCCSTFLVGGKVELLFGDWDNLWAEWRLVVEVVERRKKWQAIQLTSPDPLSVSSRALVFACLLHPFCVSASNSLPTTIKYHASSSFAAEAHRRRRGKGESPRDDEQQLLLTELHYGGGGGWCWWRTHNKVRENHWLCSFNCYLLYWMDGWMAPDCRVTSDWCFLPYAPTFSRKRRAEFVDLTFIFSGTGEKSSHWTERGQSGSEIIIYPENKFK